MERMENQDQSALRDHHRRRRRRRAGLVSLFSLALVAGAGAVLAWSYLGTPLSAPDWMRDRIEARLDAAVPDLQVDLDEVTLVVERGWRPRVRVRDVTLATDGGAPLATLSELGGSVALRPLLRGELRPGTIRVSGVRLVVRRGSGGSVDVSTETRAGDGAAAGAPPDGTERTMDLLALAGRIDAALQRPDFASLDRVELGNLTVRYEDRRTGQAWTLDGGRMELERNDGELQLRGDFALLGARAYVTTLEMNYASRIGEAGARFGFSFEDMPAGDIAGQSPSLAWLGALEAPISGSLRASVDAAGALGPLNATLQIGAGVVQPTEATKPVPFTSARSYFTYDPVAESMRFDELSVESRWGDLRAEGTAFLLGVEEGDGWPSELLAQIKVTEISANPADLYPAPVTMDEASLDMRLRLDPFTLDVGQVALSDQGQLLVMEGAFEAREEGWNVALDGRMDAISPDRLLDLWPVSVKAKTREWINENVRQAKLSNLQVAVRSAPKHRPDLFLGFDFEGLETRFMKTMPPIREAAGHASLYDQRFVIHAERGHVVAAQGGRVDISGTSFEVPDVRVKRGPAQVLLRTESTITALLSLLDEDPFNFLSKAGQPVTLADGRAEMSGQLDFLLKQNLQPEEVAFDVSGMLGSVRSEVLVPGRVLAAAQLEVTADNRLLTVGGQGRIDQVPVSGVWENPLGRPGEPATGSSLTGQIELSERFADAFRLGLPPGSISGQGRGRFEIDLERDSPAAFRFGSDLAGVGLKLDRLGWEMTPEQTGALEVSGRLGEPPEIDRLSLNAPGMVALGSVSLTPAGQLDRALFSQVEVGGWLKAPVELVGRGPGRPPAVKVTGGEVDMRRTTLAGNPDAPPPELAEAEAGAPVTLELDRLQISDGIALTGFSADLDAVGGLEGTFTGRVNDGAAINGRVVPRDGRSAFRIGSEDAGGVLGSAGLLRQARDGTMDLVLVPGKEPGSYEGQLLARNLRLKDAPALAALLNALSVVGILEQLEGDGIHFGQVDARFRLTPERVTLQSGSAVGASMGISMDGYYSMESGLMDMQGVVSPLYMFNAIGGLFTRRGEGLVGFNYVLRGTAEEPRVQVNPLSILTPGMFREIFRRPPPGVSRNSTRGDAPPERDPQIEDRQGR
ncbi:hypothetical protein DQW77_06630 [Roseovarius sp. TE539]|nr:hypothetical protein DQW77_06630 [Roseovarius sp. TE539]